MLVETGYLWIFSVFGLMAKPLSELTGFALTSKKSTLAKSAKLSKFNKTAEKKNIPVMQLISRFSFTQAH